MPAAEGAVPPAKPICRRGDRSLMGCTNTLRIIKLQLFMFFAFSGSFPPLPSLVPFHDFYSSPFSNLPSFFCFSLTPFVSPSSFFSIPYLSPFLPLFLPFFPSFPSFIHPFPPLQTLYTFLPSIHSSSLPSLPPFLHASVYLL